MQYDEGEGPVVSVTAEDPPAAVSPHAGAEPTEVQARSTARQVVGWVLMAGGFALGTVLLLGWWDARVTRYPESVRVEFVRSCAAEGAPIEACTCVLDEFERSMSVEEFAGVEAAMARTGVPEQVVEVTNACVEDPGAQRPWLPRNLGWVVCAGSLIVSGVVVGSANRPPRVARPT